MKGRHVPEAVREARRFLLGLKGKAYGYACALQRGKANPPPHGMTPEVQAAIARALAAARGQAAPGAIAAFVGLQERARGPAVELWNLLIDIPGHPAGSTVARQTIEAAGYPLPAATRRNPPRRRATSSATGIGAGVCPKGHAMHWTESGDRSRGWCQVCSRHYPTGNPPGWLDTGEDDGGGSEPDEGDYTITGTRRGGEGVAEVGGRFLGEFPSVDAALAFIVERMELEQYWSNVWTISDHGNSRLVTPAELQAATGKKGTKRNPESWPCGYCGGPGGDLSGPGHAFECSRYVKPKRRGPRSIGRKSNPARAPRSRQPRFHKGQVVIVGVGPFEGHQGIVKEIHRFPTAGGGSGIIYAVKVPRAWPSIWTLAESQLRHAGGSERAMHKKNPPRQRRGGVPKDATLLYPSARFVPGSEVRGTHYAGGRYRHPFNSRNKVRIYGLPTGETVYQAHRGRLWGYR